MLRRPAYIGHAVYGRYRKTLLQPRRRAPDGRPAQSRRGYALREVPEEECMRIAVSALVDEAIFTTDGEQLRENKRTCIPVVARRRLVHPDSAHLYRRGRRWRPG